MHITGLPPEILCEVADRLDARSLVQLSRTNRCFRSVVQRCVPHGLLARRWQENFESREPQRTVIDVTEDPPYALVQTTRRLLVTAHDDFTQGKFQQPTRRIKQLKASGNHLLFVEKQIPEKGRPAPLEIGQGLLEWGGFVESVILEGNSVLPSLFLRPQRACSERVMQMLRKNTIWFASEFFADRRLATAHSGAIPFWAQQNQRGYLRIYDCGRKETINIAVSSGGQDFKHIYIGASEGPRLLVRYDHSKTVRLWNMINGKEIKILPERKWYFGHIGQQYIPHSYVEVWAPGTQGYLNCNTGQVTEPGFENDYQIKGKDRAADGPERRSQSVDSTAPKSCQIEQIRSKRQWLQLQQDFKEAAARLNESSRDHQKPYISEGHRWPCTWGRQLVTISSGERFKIACIRLTQRAVALNTRSLSEKRIKEIILNLHENELRGMQAFSCGEKVYAILLTERLFDGAKAIDLAGFDLLGQTHLWNISYRDATSSSATLFPGNPPRIVISRKGPNNRKLLEILEPPDVMDSSLP